MSRLQQLIQELCPDGVEYKKLGDICIFERGTSITKKDIIEGNIPVIAGGQEPAYYCNQANRIGETIVISSSGAYAGYVSYWNQPIFVSDAFTVKPQNGLLTKYLYYFLVSKQERIYSLQKAGGVPHVYSSDIALLKIPLPPLPVQQEIVRILDTFTELIKELNAELDARRKQYEYYRDLLLTFGDEVELIAELCPDGVEYRRLKDVCTFKRGTSITKKDIVEGDIPVIAGGQEPAYYHNQANRTGETVVISSSGAYAGFVSYWEQPIFVSDAFSVEPNGKILTKYLYYFLKSKQDKIYSLQKAGGVPHVYSTDIAPLKIPLPPLIVQQEIVRILDTFTELIKELNAELEARKKQYEYYLNKLLDFKEVSS
jgi:type I restriction enzyme S subunit